MLELMLEILQQLYIQMDTEPDDFHFFPGDLSTYALRCNRCGQPVTLAGSIRDTLLYALVMLSFNNTITSTLSLITVLFEDLFEAITIHKDFCGEKEDPHPSISLLNKTDTFD
jgi:hypothetical protein